MSDAPPRFFARLIERRLVVIGLVVVAVLVASLSIRRLEVDNSLSSHFLEGDAELVEYQRFCADFDAGETIFVAVHLPHNLDRNEYALLHALTEALAARVPNVRSPDHDVASLSRAPLFGNLDGEVVARRSPSPDETSGAALAALRKTLLAHPLYRGLLYTEDLGYAVVAVVVRPPSEGGKRASWQEASTEAVYAILAEPRFAALESHVAGLPVLTTLYGQATKRETVRGALIAAALISLILLGCYRNLQGVVLPLAVVLVALALVYGLLAACSKLSITTTILPPLMLAIGVCASNHVLSAFEARLRTGAPRRPALALALADTAWPALLAALTTATGFAAFAVVPIPAVRDTGLLSAAGTLIAFALSYTLLPALLSFFPVRAPVTPVRATPASPLDRALTALARPGVSRPLAVLGLAVALTGTAAVGVSRITVETDWLGKFPADSRIARDYAVFDHELGGAQSFEILVSSAAPISLARLQTLRSLDELRRQVASLAGVRRIVTPVDAVKQANLELGEAAGSFALPGSQLELDDLASAGGASDATRVFKYLSADRRQLRLTVQTANLPDQALAALIQAAERAGERTLGEEFAVSTTGAAVLALETFGYIERSQRTGLTIAFAVIAALMALALRSVRLGLAAMIPNLIPVIWTAGLMGFLAIPLDTAVMLVASIAIGIAVDDTIHLTHRARRELQRDPDRSRAILRSVRGVGRPVLFTSLVLAAGFFALGGSEMKNIARFGLLSGLTVVFAWIADMVILPALLRLVARAAGRPAQADPDGPTASSFL